jgi:putative ABC transport system substrate-binding protein
MRRRQFVVLIGASVAWPLAALAQEPGRTYRLGFLTPAARERPSVAAFFDELRLNGFVEGKNLVVLSGGFASTDYDLAGQAAALVKAAPDVRREGCSHTSGWRALPSFQFECNMSLWSTEA